ncbi:MAG: hypothetical protein VKN33_03255 [Candidatus Sericytochromatia bacterium]|nr:hypothetical protein [Candidatus Sericytochromatia bacterium]
MGPHYLLCRMASGGLAVALSIVPLQEATAQVGMTRAEFEKTSGSAVDTYRAVDGSEGFIYRDTWISERNRKQFPGRTAIELGADHRVLKEVFFFDEPLPNNADGAVDAVGIAYHLMPSDTPRKFVSSGKRPYEYGWVLWFDYGQGRYINFFLDADEERIEAVVGGVESTAI